MKKTVTLALTGASGMAYGIRLLECLLAAGARVLDQLGIEHDLMARWGEK